MSTLAPESKTILNLMKQQVMTWQWHRLDHIQIISLQTHNHASTSSLGFSQARCSSHCQTNSVKALQLYRVFAYYGRPME